MNQVMSLPSDILVVVGSDGIRCKLLTRTMQGLTDLPRCSSFISCHSLPQQKSFLLSEPWLGLTCSVSGRLHWLFLQPDSPMAGSLSFRSLVQYHRLSGTSPNNLNNFILVPNPLRPCYIVLLSSLVSEMAICVLAFSAGSPFNIVSTVPQRVPDM